MTEAPPHARLRCTLTGFTIAYAVSLSIAMAGIEWFAERWLPLAFLLYAPPGIFLLPLALLAPVALWRRRWRVLAAHLACAAFVLLVFASFQFHGGGNSGGFTVVTHNIGGGNRAAFVASFPGEKPDAILLQEVRHAERLERAYTERHPAFNSRGVAQFMLLTPHEIEEAAPVADALWRGKPVAARFVIRAGGRRLAIYNVHLPTPRESLRNVRAILEMCWLSRAATDGFPSYRAWLDARMALARSLAAVFEKEALPFLVGGDFNTPNHGVIHHVFDAILDDAHTSAGSGWGYTFPGSRDGRAAALIGPWLRLDYLFAGRGWKPVDCRAAPDTRSQHRALLARFDPVEP
jgi:vancomycin resistance protein VanJ